MGDIAAERDDLARIFMAERRADRIMGGAPGIGEGEVAAADAATADPDDDLIGRGRGIGNGVYAQRQAGGLEYRAPQNGRC
jgi:hypothetical protein